MERTTMPANELEGLIRDRLPDAVRRNLMDVETVGDSGVGFGIGVPYSH